MFKLNEGIAYFLIFMERSRSVKSMQLPRTDTIRTKIMPSNSNREITEITDSQNTKRTHCQLSEQLRNGDRSATFTELV